LANGNFGKNLIDQEGRRFGHLASAAGRAKSPLFAREGDDLFVIAVLASNPEEAVGQDATFEEVVELVTDVLRKAFVRGVLIEGGQERFPMFGDGFVEDAVLRSVAFVIRKFVGEDFGGR